MFSAVIVLFCLPVKALIFAGGNNIHIEIRGVCGGGQQQNLRVIVRSCWVLNYFLVLFCRQPLSPLRSSEGRGRQAGKAWACSAHMGTT